MCRSRFSSISRKKKMSYDATPIYFLVQENNDRIILVNLHYVQCTIVHYIYID